MKILTLIFSTCLAFQAVIAVPSVFDNFGKRINRVPSREGGWRDYNWHEGDEVNSEELDPYAEGDIPSGISLKNGRGGESNRWPNKTIPYIITGTSFTEADRAMIQNAMDEVHYHSCVRFVSRTSEPVYIRITSKFRGCYSSVGYTGQNYDVNLQAGGCTSYKGTVLHELMRVIGFVHEHSRAERDDYITVNMDNVEDDAKNENDRDTIATKPDPNVGLGQHYGISKSDILKINRMYNCTESSTVRPGTITTIKPSDGTRPTVSVSFSYRPQYLNQQPVLVRQKRCKVFSCSYEWIPMYPVEK